MRTLSQILTDVEDGKRPEYEELRYALMAYRALLTFDQRALMRLAEAQREGQKPILTRSPQWQWEEHFRRVKTALETDPKVWVGWGNDPDNPEFQQRRAISLKVFNKVMEKEGNV